VDQYYTNRQGVGLNPATQSSINNEEEIGNNTFF